MGYQSRDSIELEATLVVCTEHPGIVLRRIGEMAFVNEFRLVPQPAKLIRDTYFDTGDGALASAKWALRVRAIGERQWIALKGPTTATDMGGVRRVEVELAWSVAALEKVLAELSDYGLSPCAAVNISATLPPPDALHALGFVVIQDRETRRQVRDIVSPQDEQVAEMALDTVAYHLSAGRIFHEEVEIEAKAPSGSRAIGVILDYFMREFGSQVRTWDFGKLATGIALDRLLERGRAPDLIAPDGHLSPAAYDELREFMQ
jgi:hypothetical protein